MSERRTRQAVDLSSSTEFTDEGGGTFRAYFAPLDIQGRGASEQEAFDALAEQLGVILRSDAEAREVFGKWAEEHIIEQEMTPEEIAEEKAMEALAASAGHDFPELTVADFDGAIASSTPLLVDFWAPWCQPCLMAAPVLKEIHDEMSGAFDVAKVNVDDNREIQERYGFQGIPCFIMFRNGEEVDRIIGFAPRAQFQAAIEELLAKA